MISDIIPRTSKKYFIGFLGNKNWKEKHIIDSYFTKYYNETYKLCSTRVLFVYNCVQFVDMALEHGYNIRQKHINKSLILSTRRFECLLKLALTQKTLEKNL